MFRAEQPVDVPPPRRFELHVPFDLRLAVAHPQRDGEVLEPDGHRLSDHLGGDGARLTSDPRIEPSPDGGSGHGPPVRRRVGPDAVGQPDDPRSVGGDRRREPDRRPVIALHPVGTDAQERPAAVVEHGNLLATRGGQIDLPTTGEHGGRDDPDLRFDARHEGPGPVGVPGVGIHRGRRAGQQAHGGRGHGPCSLWTDHDVHPYFCVQAWNRAW